MNAPAAEQPEMRRQRPDRRSSGGWLARRLGVGVAALFAVGALPAVAGATDYCVAPNTSCGGTNVASMQGALDQAANTAEPDRVFLGATVYPAPNPGGHSYHQASSPVEIHRPGRRPDDLTSPAGGGEAVVRAKARDYVLSSAAATAFERSRKSCCRTTNPRRSSKS